MRILQDLLLEEIQSLSCVFNTHQSDRDNPSCVLTRKVFFFLAAVFFQKFILDEFDLLFLRFVGERLVREVKSREREESGTDCSEEGNSNGSK